jgi:hypothetical protein
MPHQFHQSMPHQQTPLFYQQGMPQHMPHFHQAMPQQMPHFQQAMPQQMPHFQQAMPMHQQQMPHIQQAMPMHQQQPPPMAGSNSNHIAGAVQCRSYQFRPLREVTSLLAHFCRHCKY